MKAEDKTRLTDDIYVAAYQKEGSYRKAAEWLSQETGQRITKEKISGAVHRRGGPTTVLRAENSNSVCRRVSRRTVATVPEKSENAINS